ncbi:MAG: ATP-binding protein [Eubacterium sp.]|nr:ATP-binding protein [Eubacterium sp.]
MAKYDRTIKQLTKPVHKVPYCIQDTIPIYRIAENGIFELEKKKGRHLFDRVYLFEDINFSTQDEDEKEQTDKKFKKLLNSMNVSYKIIVSNHYADNSRLRESILHKASRKQYEPLAREYHRLINKRMDEGRNGIEQSRYYVVTCRETDFESAKNYFNTIEYSIMQFFRSFGSGLVPLDACERLRALHGFYRMGEEEKFEFDWDQYLSLKRDWRNDIINVSLKEHKEYLEFESGKTACTLFVRKYASGLSDKFMNELMMVSFPVMVTLDIEPLDNASAYNLTMKKYMNNERSIIRQQEAKNNAGDYSSNISYEKRTQQKELEEMLDDIHSFDERLFYVGITILIRAGSMEELMERKEKIRIIGQTYNMDIVPHSYNQLDAMNTTLPTGVRFVDTMRTIKTDSLSVFAPFNVQEIQDEGGFCYGVNEVTKNLVNGNRKKLKNGNGMVFGVPGCGKSFDEKMEMGQVYAFTEDDIIIIDPMGEYREIANAWNGAYYNLSQSRDNVYYINPFHVPETVPDKDRFIAEKAEFAYAICEQALKPSPLSSKHIAVIDRAVRTMYDGYFSQYDKASRKEKKEYSRHNSPTISLMREKIREESTNPDAEELFEQLEVFAEGTLDIFSRQQSVSPENRFTVYGFSELGKRMRSMAMLVMIESITSRIKYNQSRDVATWVYVDEIHELWGEEYSLSAIKRMWREVRKRGGICTGMTQNIIEATDNNEIKTMVSNSEFTMLLDQGVMDKEDVSEIFKLSDKQAGYVNGAKKGCGLIRFGKKIVPFNNMVDKGSDLYQLFNTDFHEMAGQKDG